MVSTRRSKYVTTSSTHVASSPPIVETVVEEEEDLEGCPPLWKKKIRCSDFGPLRKQIYPCAAWCSKCDFWEDQLASGQIGRAKRTSQNFECMYVTSKLKKHKSLLFPFPFDPKDPATATRRSPVSRRTKAPVKYACSDSDSESDTDTDTGDSSSDDDCGDDDGFLSGDEFCSYIGNITPHASASNPSNTLRSTRMATSTAELPTPVPLFHQPNTSVPPVNYDETPAPVNHNNNPPVEPTSCAAELRQSNASLKRSLNEAQQNLKSARRKITNLEKKVDEREKKPPPKASAKAVASYVGAYLDSREQSEYRTVEASAENLVTRLIDKKKSVLVEEKRKVLLEAFKKPVVKEYCSTNYPPHAVSRLQDLTGGQFALTTLDLLNSLATKGKLYSRDGFLPSSSGVKRVRRAVERYGRKRIKCKKGTIKGTKGGEFYEFNVDDLLVYAIKAFGLEEVAKHRAVRISVSIDGAQLSKRLTHVTCGFKVADIAARCPFTGRSLFMDADQALLQSRNLCIPVKIGMCKETKEIYRNEFENIFVRFHELSDKYDGALPIDSAFTAAGFKPIRVAVNCDMSAQWKMFGTGGAAKVHTFPCHCCPIKSANLARPNSVHCSLCVEVHPNRDPSWKCYHHPMMTKELIDTTEADFAEMSKSLEGILDELDEIRKDSVINQEQDPRAPMGNSRSDPHSIHFDWAADDITAEEVQQYGDRLEEDLALRGEETVGSIPLLQKRLTDLMIKEWTFLQLKDAVLLNGKLKNVVFMLLEAPPCVLHLENRVGLTIIRHLLQLGINNAHNQVMYNDISGEKRRRLQLVEDVETYINNNVLGDEDNPAQFACPAEDSAKHIGIICLDNNRTRKIVNQLSGLIDICLPDDEERQSWKNAICLQYSPAINLLRSKENLTEHQIIQFQKHIDLFFQLWVVLIPGAKGVTNYIHLLKSGHVMEYLKYWRSLYPHSQQGWEALNSLLKTYYFRATSRGGKSGGKYVNGDKTRVRPIGRWMLRRIVWSLGIPWEKIELEYIQELGSLQSKDPDANEDVDANEGLTLEELLQDMEEGDDEL
jgi:hypothetical protein